MINLRTRGPATLVFQLLTAVQQNQQIPQDGKHLHTVQADITPPPLLVVGHTPSCACTEAQQHNTPCFPPRPWSGLVLQAGASVWREHRPCWSEQLTPVSSSNLIGMYPPRGYSTHFWGKSGLLTLQTRSWPAKLKRPQSSIVVVHLQESPDNLSWCRQL